jgi:ComF family protein
MDLCRICRLAPPLFVRAVAYGPYQDRMKAAIHALKYDRLYPVARGLGRMLAEAIGRLAAEAPAEMLVVPVPLHRSKVAQRGFNQARALAAYALDALRKSHPEWRLTLAPSTLMRLRATESQAGLSFRQRRLNVRGAFLVSDPATVARKHILVIDDIFTTGATVRAAAQVLIAAGAASVWVATLARAVRSNPIRRGSDLFFNDAETGSLPEAVLLPASVYSSHGQPSF